MRLSFQHLFLVVAATLAGASLFFTVRVVAFKGTLRTQGGVQALQSGQKARVSRVLDGDEVVVLLGAEPLTVRILGISTFNPTLNDPQIQPAALRTLQHLEQTLAGREVALVFDELKYDARKRLLAYVHLAGMDVGRDLVGRGLALTYTRYPFSRMADYLLLEEQARQASTGLWSDPPVALRARQLRTVWEAERAKGD